MRMFEDIKLKWFLYGFFSSCEGWNGECPFSMTNVKDYTNKTVGLLEDVKVLIKYKDEDIIKLIKEFKKLLDEEYENLKVTVDMACEICKLIEEVV